MFASSIMLFQGHFSQFYSRKLLIHAHISQQATTTVAVIATTSPAPSPYMGNKSFDANVVMVLSVLLCALVCSLGLNSIVRCALRCSSLVRSESITSQESTTAKLANTGIKKKALKTFPTASYWEGLKLPGFDKECVICLGEFASGELVKILPKCNHGFHARCVDKWLSSHSSCPSCRHSLIETYQKINSVDPCSSTTSSQFQGQNNNTDVVTITTLQAERFVQNYEM